MSDYVKLNYNGKVFEVSRDEFHNFCDYYKTEIFDEFKDYIESQFMCELKEYFLEDAQASFDVMEETRQETNNKRFRED